MNKAERARIRTEAEVIAVKLETAMARAEETAIRELPDGLLHTLGLAEARRSFAIGWFEAEVRQAAHCLRMLIKYDLTTRSERERT